jgi:hypothetical protein
LVQTADELSAVHIYVLLIQWPQSPTSAKPGPRFERGEAGFEFKIEKIGAAPHGQCRTTPQHSLSGCDALNAAANRAQRAVDVSGQIGRTSYHGREYGCQNQSVLQQVLT